jgi:phospholipase A1
MDDAETTTRTQAPHSMTTSATSLARQRWRPAALLLCLPLTCPAQAHAADIAARLARCAGIGAEQARLACFDALAAGHTADTAAPAAPAPAPSEPPGDAAPVTARTAAPDPAAPDPAVADAEPQRRVLGIQAYRKNYVLPVTYNDNVNPILPEEEALELPFLGEDALDDLEMKFQISFEVPLWTRILNRPLDLYFAYTQLAFFQVYNSEYSSPFRETNYEPEAGLHWLPDWRIGGAGSRWRLTSARVAANHQSNGRSEPLSRSWNRLTGEVNVERDGLSLGLRLWTLLGASPSDNPDIDDYLGYGELRAGYDFGRHRIGLMLRSLEHPTVQLDWSYPIAERVRLYAQYFNGYGESLLDYDHSVNRIGIGFLLEDGMP